MKGNEISNKEGGIFFTDIPVVESGKCSGIFWKTESESTPLPPPVIALQVYVHHVGDSNRSIRFLGVRKRTVMIKRDVI